MENWAGNKKQDLKNNHYLRKASPSANYWFDFAYQRLNSYIEQFGNDFCIVLHGDERVEGDFFAIPFYAVKEIFVEKYLSQSTKEDRPARWVGNIKFNQFHVTNCPFEVDVAMFYGNVEHLHLATDVSENPDEFVDPTKHIATSDSKDLATNEYAIENRKIEIQARQKQSRFRRLVLDNFEARCCVCGISENELLVASHIIPWANRIDTRLDPANGLCLSALCDKLFDKGFITLNHDLRILITDEYESFSKPLQLKLRLIKGTQIHLPTKYPIKTDYLAVHRGMFSHGWV